MSTRVPDGSPDILGAGQMGAADPRASTSRLGRMPTIRSRLGGARAVCPYRELRARPRRGLRPRSTSVGAGRRSRRRSRRRHGHDVPHGRASIPPARQRSAGKSRPRRRRSTRSRTDHFSCAGGCGARSTARERPSAKSRARPFAGAELRGTSRSATTATARSASRARSTTSSRARPFSGRTAWARSIQTPLRDFLRTETGGAAVLLAAAVAALFWVNVDASSYEEFWGTMLSIDLGGAGVSLDLRHWVNKRADDALLLRPRPRGAAGVRPRRAAGSAAVRASAARRNRRHGGGRRDLPGVQRGPFVCGGVGIAMSRDGLRARPARARRPALPRSSTRGCSRSSSSTTSSRSS